jgi:hypothetical protein
MISVRRFLASMLAGALLVLVSAAQASAQAGPSLERAFEGIGLGLAAASEIAASDVIVVDDSLISALGAFDAWFAKHGDEGTSNRQGDGQGPVNAQNVHEMLLDAGVPGQLNQASGSKLSQLDGVYGKLKSESDQAKKLKDDKSQDDKSQDDKSKSEASAGIPGADAPGNQGGSNKP